MPSARPIPSTARGRWPRRVRRGGLWVGGVLVLAWAASLFGQFTWHQGNGLIVGFIRGSAGVAMNKFGWGSQFKRGWTIQSSGRLDQARWLPEWHFGSAKQWWVWVPLWVPAAAAFAGAGAGWRLEVLAHRRAGVCPRCGYSREGLPRDAVCPECGGAA